MRLETNAVSYDTLKFGPWEVQHILDAKLEKNINDHGKLYFYGIISEETKDSYISMAKEGAKIYLDSIGESGTIKLFAGNIDKIEVKNVRGIYYLKIWALGSTIEMDVKNKNRSFQDSQMGYKDLFKETVSEFTKADFIDNLSNGKAIGKYIMQYKETDWEFLKRVVSQLGGCIIPDSRQENPKFWIGRKDKGEVKKIKAENFASGKNVVEYKKSVSLREKCDESDFQYYEVESIQNFELGDFVEFNGKEFQIKSITTYIEKSILKNLYLLVSKEGMTVDKIYNKDIEGISIKGKVLESIKDKVKVHLEIDSNQDKGKAWEFKYATPYSSEGSAGWYCMPEEGDSLYVYFPNEKEENGFAKTSIREGNSDSKLADPNTKYFRTKCGKELKFSPDEILITAQDGQIYIKLNTSGGIEIKSSKDITITSKDNINIESNKKIIMTGEDAIDIKCKESHINMDDNIIIGGKQIKVN